jgi:hypothetical protein
VPTRPTSAQQILGENAELSARLKLAESIAAQRSSELETLKKEIEQLRAERTRYCERVVLLEEELSWIKSQYFGSISQKQDAAAIDPNQPMLFTRPRCWPPSPQQMRPISSAPRRSKHREKTYRGTQGDPGALSAHSHRA